MKKYRKLLGNRAGNAMIEFAIGSGVLVMAFSATFQYGYIFYQYNALRNAVTNAAHLGGVYTYCSSNNVPNSSPCNTTPTLPGWSTAVKNMAVYGNPNGTGSPVLTGLTTANIQYSVTGIGDYTATPNTWRPTMVTVWVTGYTINAVFGSYTTANKPMVSYPYQGFFNP